MIVLLLPLLVLPFAAALEEESTSAVINADGEMIQENDNLKMRTFDLPETSLDKYLGELVRIPFSELVEGNYEFKIPPKFESGYRKLNQQRANKLKEDMKWVWNEYSRCCMGYDEIRPRSGEPFNYWGGIGMMVVESLDTLYLMNLTKEFKQGVSWVEKSLNYDKPHFTSVFETIIRCVGGLEAAYHLSKEKVLLDKVVDLSDRLIQAFSSDSGLNHPNLELSSKRTRAHENTITLAEMATNYLEFKYLSELSKDGKYGDVSDRIIDFLYSMKLRDGMYPISYEVRSGRIIGGSSGMGNLADSFYEYLLKGFIQTKKEDTRLLSMYRTSVKGMFDNQYHFSHPEKFRFVSDTVNSAYQMHQLQCFTPGMLALGVSESTKDYLNMNWHVTESELIEELKVKRVVELRKDDPINEFIMKGKRISEDPIRDLRAAKQLMTTCFVMYNMTDSGLCSEKYQFDFPRGDDEEKGKQSKQQNTQGKPTSMHTSSLNKYLLRPETIESLYVLHSVTQDPIFVEWGWKIYQSIDTHCRSKYAFGDLSDVNAKDASSDDRGETFFYAETMKYLYLLFSDPEGVYLRKGVFNTEAHYLPRF